ncbi:MAG: hypothetical protein Q9167_002280 [Letrouitia subvulpina]
MGLERRSTDLKSPQAFRRIDFPTGRQSHWSVHLCEDNGGAAIDTGDQNGDPSPESVRPPLALQTIYVTTVCADLHADWTYARPSNDDPMSPTHNNVATYRLDDFTGNAFNELPFDLSPNLGAYDYRPSHPVDPMQFWDPEIFNHSGEQSYMSYPSPLPATNAAGDHRRVRTQRNLRR